MATPDISASTVIEAYKGDDLSLVWTFTDANDSSKIDIDDVYGAINFIVFKFGQESSPIIDKSLSDMDISDTNKLTLALTDTEIDSLRGNNFYYKLKVDIGTTDKTFLTNDFIVHNYKEGSQTESAFDIYVDNTTQITNIQTSGLYNEALAELAKVSVPETVILVDGDLTDNQTPAFDNIDDAVTAAYAVIADGASKCVIRAYADASGVPYNLDDYDYYTLRDANIFFKSPFDAWKDYVTNGGTISQSDLLYDVPQDELSFNING